MCRSDALFPRDLLQAWGMTGLHFCATGYCVSTVGLDEHRIRQYIHEQEKMESGQGELDLKCVVRRPNGTFLGSSPPTGASRCARPARAGLPNAAPYARGRLPRLRIVPFMALYRHMMNLNHFFLPHEEQR
jgi:hypothetical protein